MPYTKKEHYEGKYLARQQEYAQFLGGSCAVCGESEDLEFDHINWQTKDFPIMKRWGSADQARVYEELKKCQLLCVTHHKIKSSQDAAERSYYQPINHGSQHAWARLKCPCKICLAAKRAWNDARNERRRNANLVPS